MELDQLLFKKLSSFYRRLRTPQIDPLVEARTAHLEEVKARLCLLAKALSGEAIEIATAEAEGGWRDKVFFLPASFSKGLSKEENESYYLFRVAYLAQQKKLALNALEKTISIEQARLLAQQSSGQILKSLFNEYPNLEPLYLHLQNLLHDKPHYLWGHWMSSSLLSNEKENKKNNFNHPDKAKAEITTELKAKPTEEVEILEVNQKAIEDYSLGHNFEKIETLEEFKGNWRDCEGDDDLQEHAEALNELNLKQMIRVDQAAHSLLQADFLSAGTLTESKELKSEKSYLSYDEWNFQKRSYRTHYCKVFVEVFSKSDFHFRAHLLKEYGVTLRQLKKQFQSVLTERELRQRQKEGEEIDFDALIESYTDLAAGKTPSENLYLSSRKTHRDLAIIILIDRSLSTDAYTQGQRILDVEKKSVFLFSELLNDAQDSFQIDAFSSRTRNHCEYVTLKSFQDSCLQGQARLGALDSLGYTRIGPALRHATQQLEKLSHKKKWILLLSDGKPNDYDRYEGEYGIQDVRQAVREMNQKNIQLYALAIESQAKHYLPRMLGQKNFKILPRPEFLPQALSDFYVRLNAH